MHLHINPRSGTALRLAIALVVLGAGAWGCSARKGEPARRPSVLLVTIDTLRADHVGCYGYRAAATPTLDGARRARRPLRDRSRPRAPHRSVAHLDPHQPNAARPRRARQRQLRPAPDGAQRGRGLPAGRVPDGRVRVRLPAQAPFRPRSRLRNLRRSAAAREGRPPDGLRGEDGGSDDGRRPALARHAAPGGPGPVLPLGALLRPACPLRGAGGVRSAGRLALRRRDLVRGRPARPAAAPRRGDGTVEHAARPRHRGPRREPGRARRGHPRHLRLRLDAPRALHPRRPRCARGPRGGDRRAGHRRRTDAARLRGTRGEGNGWAVAARSGLWRERGGPAVLRGVPPPAAPVRLGPSPRVANGALQAHRSAPARAVRPRRPTRGKRETVRARTRRASRRCAATCRG